jgi:hypothetical protein
VPQSDAIGVDDDRRVVVEPGRATLKERSDDDDATRGRQPAERRGARPGDRLGQIEVGVLLGLAEIARSEELLGADDLRPTVGRLADLVR